MKSIFRRIFLQNYHKPLTQKGQSLVELALTITLLVTLLAGAFDLGMAFLDYIALRDAAQEGAMYGSVNPKDIDSIVERIRYSSNKPLDFSEFPDSNSNDCSNSNPNNAICVDIPTPCTGNLVTVTVLYHYQVIMPGLGFFLKDQSIPLHSTVTNVILTEKCNS